MNILDTDTLSYFEQGRQQVVQRVVGRPLSETAITVISIEEQFSGRQAYLRKAKTTAQLADAYQKMTDTARVLSGFHIVTFSEAAIRRYNSLLALKLNMGAMDLRIAAIALEENAVVITRNLRDFGRVPGLACENWAD
jgi:tRNA(fMet)-specific endonuclease VapC